MVDSDLSMQTGAGGLGSRPLLLHCSDSKVDVRCSVHIRTGVYFTSGEAMQAVVEPLGQELRRAGMAEAVVDWAGGLSDSRSALVSSVCLC